MKPKITDFVNCGHLLFSLSHITFIEVTVNQWRDAKLTCCLSVNRNTSLNNESLVYLTGGGRIVQDEGRISQEGNRQRGEKP